MKRDIRNVLLALCLPIALTAQARRGSALIGIGGGIAHASTREIGPDSHSKEQLFTVQIGVTASTRTDLVLDVVIKPFKGETHGDVATPYTLQYYLFGAQIGLRESRRLFIRPSLGFGRKRFHLEGGETRDDIGILAAGIAVGYEMSVTTSLSLTPEVFLHELQDGDSFYTNTFGLGIRVVPIGARKR